MADEPVQSRRQLLTGLGVTAACGSSEMAHGRAVPPPTSGATWSAGKAPQGDLADENIGLITADLLGLPLDRAQHGQLGNALRSYGFAVLEIRGRYVEAAASVRPHPVEVRGWFVRGNDEDSGNLKGHLRKLGRLHGQAAVIVKGYYRPTVLHALADLPSLGLAAGDTRELGPLRAACLGAYVTLLRTGAHHPPPVPFVELAADLRGADWLGGRWEKVGIWTQQTFFNSARSISFDEQGNRVEQLSPRPGI